MCTSIYRNASPLKRLVNHDEIMKTFVISLYTNARPVEGVRCLREFFFGIRSIIRTCNFRLLMLEKVSSNLWLGTMKSLREAAT